VTAFLFCTRPKSSEFMNLLLPVSLKQPPSEGGA
jgi:hypothetical protein